MPSVMCNAYSYACMTSYLFVMRDRFLPTFLDENSLIWINTSLAPLLHIFIMPSCISRVGEMRPEDGCVSRCWHHHHPHRPSMLMCASPKTIHFWKKKTELISSASKAVWIDVPVTGMLSLPRPMMMDACSHGANFQPTRSQHLGHIFFGPIKYFWSLDFAFRTRKEARNRKSFCCNHILGHHKNFHVILYRDT